MSENKEGSWGPSSEDGQGKDENLDSLINSLSPEFKLKILDKLGGKRVTKKSIAASETGELVRIARMIGITAPNPFRRALLIESIWYVYCFEPEPVLPWEELKKNIGSEKERRFLIKKFTNDFCAWLFCVIKNAECISYSELVSRIADKVRLWGKTKYVDNRHKWLLDYFLRYYAPAYGIVIFWSGKSNKGGGEKWVKYSKTVR